MMRQKKSSDALIIRRFISAIVLVLGMCLFHTSAQAAVTSFTNSDSQDSYYTVNLDQDKIILEGRTTDPVNSYTYMLLKYEGNTGYGTPVTGKIANGSYKEEINLPEKNGRPEDGEYQLYIELTDAKVSPYIIVKEGKAAIYRADSFATDLTADAFIRTLDKDDLYQSNSDNIYNSSPSDLHMTGSQIEELHQLAVNCAEGQKTDYEKAKAVYQWVTDNIYYDYDSAYSEADNGDNNPYSVYKNRYSVCEGYARLTVEMLRSLKIPSVVIGGAAQAAPITKDGGSGHAWVAIFADGRWFYADPTWDSQNTYKNKTFMKKDSRLEYFDLTPEAISQTHRVQDIEAAVSLNDFNITFYREHISVETYEGEKSVISLPRSIEGLPVTQVSASFIRDFNTNVKEIIVPEGYEALTDAAFQCYVSLKYIILPDTIESIGDYAFLNSQDSVTIYCNNSEIVRRYSKDNNISFSSRIPDSAGLNSQAKFSIADAVCSVQGKMTYTGEEQRPEPAVAFGGILLKQGIDYTVSYKNNILPGKAEIEIKGKGNYEGIRQLTFNIVPDKVTVKLSSLKKSTVRAVWTKSSGALGYEVRYSTMKEGSYRLLGTAYSEGYTTGKLTSGRRYYIKVRPYIIADGAKIYGSYSTVVSVRIK